MAFGVGAFTQGMLRVLREDGARVSTYLTRNYAHHAPSLEGPTFDFARHPNPVPLLRRHKIDFVVPMSIEWVQKPWCHDLLQSGVPIFSPTGEAMQLERDRDFARKLCRRFAIPFPESHVAMNLRQAEKILRRAPKPYVIKNPICSPTSPVHTIVCESVEDTRGWLPHINYAEGIFLQEYMGRAEAGHIALVSGGEIHSLVTNQEYKRAFDGNMGIVAGAPLGGLVERDPGDKYGLAKNLLHPLLPWFRKTNFHGPVQVTAIRRRSRWHVLEYNVRIGVTSGPMILRLFENPLEILHAVSRNQSLNLRWRKSARFGCSLTLAGFGYPYVKVEGPALPIEVDGKITCDVWWNEVTSGPQGKLHMTGHRICDVVAVGPTLAGVISRAYENIKKIRCLGSYFRTDIGQTLWPPGSE
jgi:phosphoribosylamine-glycine ligase